ncbi:MAG: GntR family transcriptional regulator [bacterium]
MRASRPIHHDSLADMVYQGLFDDMVNGRLRPGQRLTEQEISQARGISRAPVREAIARLAVDGLLRLVPRSGCYVCRLSERDIQHIFDLRVRLETLALDYAFDVFDQVQLAQLRAKLVACQGRAERRLLRDEEPLDTLFHATILNAAASPLLQDLLGKLLARIRVFQAIGSRDPGKARDALENHVALLVVIIAGDRRTARRRLQQHLEVARNNAVGLAAFFSGNADPPPFPETENHKP